MIQSDWRNMRVAKWTKGNKKENEMKEKFRSMDDGMLELETHSQIYWHRC